MFAQRQFVRKHIENSEEILTTATIKGKRVIMKQGSASERLEGAFNIDLKEINEKIKNCREIKKILVKNLKISQGKNLYQNSLMGTKYFC
jgi:tyrosine-protein phosphatase YwqE